MIDHKNHFRTIVFDNIGVDRLRHKVADASPSFNKFRILVEEIFNPSTGDGTMVVDFFVHEHVSISLGISSSVTQEPGPTRC